MRIGKKEATYLYKVGKEQDVGGGRPHVSPWGIPSTTAYHRYPRAAPRPLPRALPRRGCPPLSCRWVSYPSFSFSHHSHRILSIAIIGTLHTEDPPGPRTNTEYPLARVLREGGRFLFSVAPSTKHLSSTLCNRRIRARLRIPESSRESESGFSSTEATRDEDEVRLLHLYDAKGNLSNLNSRDLLFSLSFLSSLGYFFFDSLATVGSRAKLIAASLGFHKSEVHGLFGEHRRGESDGARESSTRDARHLLFSTRGTGHDVQHVFHVRATRDEFIEIDPRSVNSAQSLSLPSRTQSLRLHATLLLADRHFNP